MQVLNLNSLLTLNNNIDYKILKDDIILFFKNELSTLFNDIKFIIEKIENIYIIVVYEKIDNLILYENEYVIEMDQNGKLVKLKMYRF
jgi:hypothetical protein